MTPSDPASLIRQHCHRRFSIPLASLGDDVPFGAEGLGLDSIAIAEFLLECERDFGVDALAVLEGKSVTVRSLVASIRPTPGR